MFLPEKLKMSAGRRWFCYDLPQLAVTIAFAVAFVISATATAITAPPLQFLWLLLLIDCCLCSPPLLPPLPPLSSLPSAAVIATNILPQTSQFCCLCHCCHCFHRRHHCHCLCFRCYAAIVSTDAAISVATASFCRHCLHKWRTENGGSGCQSKVRGGKWSLYVAWKGLLQRLDVKQF